VVQHTEYVLGFGPEGLLVSTLNGALTSALLSTGDFTQADNVISVLSPAPLASGLASTFTATGSFTPTPTPGLAVKDTTTGQAVAATAQPYVGPVSGLQEQFIDVTPDSVNISVSTPNWFIHSGSGTDAIAVSSGTNVLDGGAGSNFLTGGSGTDNFFVDDRNPSADIWSTLNNFHAGDVATLWGISQSAFALDWINGQGASGYTGLTLHASEAGKPNASVTLAGYSQTDLSDGRISLSYGFDAASGSNFLQIHANS
jgi:Ca2+-binding RTX toxin-like protein